jgi:hypothetical protein
MDVELIGDVKRDSHAMHPQDPDATLTANEKIKGYKYGSQYIPVTEADEQAMKLQSPAGIFVLGAIPASSVKRHHFMDFTRIVQGHENVEAAQVGVCALATALRKNKSVLLVRWVAKENADPILAALIPPVNDNGTLVLQRLPCKDEISVFSFPHTPPLPSSEAMDAMSRFVDASTVVPGSGVVGRSLPTPRALADRMLSAVSPSYHAVLNDVIRKFLGRAAENDNGMSSGGFLSGRSATATVTLLSASAAPQPGEARRALTELKSLMPLTKAEGSEDAVKKRKVFFNEIDASSGKSAIAMMTSNSAAAQQQEVAPEVHLGSTTPIEDLAAALGHAASTKVSRAAALRAMGDIALGLVDGAGDSYYQRSVVCLAALRAASLREGADACLLFNSLLVERFKPLMAGRRHAGLLQLLQAPGAPRPFSVSDCEGEELLQHKEAESFWAHAEENDKAGTSEGAGGLVSQRPVIPDMDDLE